MSSKKSATSKFYYFYFVTKGREDDKSELGIVVKITSTTELDSKENWDALCFLW